MASVSFADPTESDSSVSDLLITDAPDVDIATEINNGTIASPAEASSTTVSPASSVTSITSVPPADFSLTSETAFVLPPEPPSGIVVFSGGSAANNLVDVFASVAQSKKAALSYVIPISDNGGSSSELIRVFGGPGKLVISVSPAATLYLRMYYTAIF